MRPWKKTAVAADKQDMVVDDDDEQRERIADDDDDDDEQRERIADGGDDDGTVAEVPAVVAPETTTVAEVPKTVTIEKVYEHLIVFDLSGQRPFVKNANPVDLANEIAMLEISPTYADNCFAANILAQRNICDSLYGGDIGVGLPARSDFGVRLVPHVSGERQHQDQQENGIMNDEGQFQDDDERQFLNGGHREVRRRFAVARANNENVDENSTTCFQCSIRKGICSVL